MKYFKPKNLSKFCYWAPRVLSLLFVGFISSFAFDVIGDYSGLGLVIALGMHLLTSIFLLIAIAFAWKYELVGAIAFSLFGFWYTWQAREYWTWSLVIAVPSFIIAALFLKNWIYKDRSLC